MDQTRDGGRMDCTAPQADALRPEIAEMDVCLAAEHPKEIEKNQGSTYEERSSTCVSEHTTVQPQDENGRYERNLKKFLENGKTSLEIRSREETKVSERLIKSDGVVETRGIYFGNVSKISSILSEVRLKRSSAPPTYEISSGENPETKEIEVQGHQSTTSESVGIPPGNSKTPVSFRTRGIPMPASASNNSMTPSRDFKVPVAAAAASTPGQTSTPGKASTPGQASTPTPLVSPGSSKIRVGESTPGFSRPTNFIMKPRKAFYMFSPEDSGILRHCQSLPNIRRQRKEEKHHRRSLVLEDRSRIVRSLFNDPPGPATPETRRSMVPKSHIPGPSREAVAKEPKGRSSLGNIKANICRRLTFAQPGNTSGGDATEEQNPEEGKRKETSPPFAECPPAPVKKVRMTPELEKREDVGTGSHIPGQESKLQGDISDVPREKKANPVKRKSGESSNSKKK